MVRFWGWITHTFFFFFAGRESILDCTALALALVAASAREPWYVCKCICTCVLISCIHVPSAWTNASWLCTICVCVKGRAPLRRVVCVEFVGAPVERLSPPMHSACVHPGFKVFLSPRSLRWGSHRIHAKKVAGIPAGIGVVETMSKMIMVYDDHSQRVVNKNLA